MTRKILAFVITVSLLVVWTSLLTQCQQQPYVHGKIMYENFCVNCHMEDGTGLPGNIPPLVGADYLTQRADQLPCIIRHGVSGELVVNGQTYNAQMPANPQLTDVEIANIINYINHAWGNDNGYTSVKTVQEYLTACD